MRVFVYGSLRKGQIYHHVIESAEFVGSAETPPLYELFDLGDYPAMVRGGRTRVQGEVYEVGAGLLEVLDEFEDHPELYQRQEIGLADGQRVKTYLYPRESLKSPVRVDDGDWPSYRELSSKH